MPRGAANRIRSGSLEVAAPGDKTALFRLKLGRVGVFRATRDAKQPADGFQRLRAEMYVEAWSFEPPAGF